MGPHGYCPLAWHKPLKSPKALVLRVFARAAFQGVSDDVAHHYREGCPVVTPKHPKALLEI